jgi:integrase
MAQGSIRKHERDSGVRYEVVVDLGTDPVTGRRRQRSKSFKTKRAAQAALATMLADIDKGTAVDRSRQTVAQMMQYWLDTYARHRCAAKTVDDYERTIRVHIIPALGAIQAQKLTPDVLQKFYGDKLAAGCGPRTVELCHLRLSQALDQSVKLGLLTRNVADLVTPPRVPRKPRQTWDEEQARRFLAVADQSGRGPIWIVALATGMRRGELLGLRWQDVDFERDILSVRQTVGALRGKPDVKPPKTRSSIRDVPVPAEVMAALREHRRRQNEQRLALGPVWEDNDLVFAAANGRPIYPDNLKRDFERLVHLAGVPRIRIHDQRHTHVTLAIAAGADIGAVSQRIGHSRTSITMDVYHHVLPRKHLEVSDKVGAVLFGQRAADHAADHS